MGVLRSLGLKRESWAEKEAKLAKEEEQQKLAQPPSEYELQFEAFLKNVPDKREEMERKGKIEEQIEFDKEEAEMLREFIEGTGYRCTGKAENRLGETGEGLKNGLTRFWGKLKEVATAAYIVPKEMGKFAGYQVKDLVEGLGEGTAAALSKIPEAGYSIAEFAKSRVAKPAKEIYGKYSEEVSKSLGIGAGVAATKYEAASEWVKVNSAKSWTQGKEALGKFGAGIVRVNESFNETLKQWPVERQLKRAKKSAFETQEAALLAEQKAAQLSEKAVQAAKEYDALRSAFENAG